MRYQPHQLRSGSEMDEFRRRQADQLHGKRMKRIPYFFAAAKKLFVDLSFCRFFVVLLQRGLSCKRIEEIAVKADSGLFIYKFLKFGFIRLSVRADQPIQGLQKRHAKNHRSGIQIHVSMGIYRAQRAEPLFTLFMQELPHIVIPVIQEYAMLLSGFHIFLHGNGRRATRIKIDLQGVEQKKYISGKHQHSFRDAGRHPGHADHKFIKQGGTESIGKLPRNRRKQLPTGGILGYPFAVTAGMNDQDAKTLEGLCTGRSGASDLSLRPLLAGNVIQHMQGGSSGADPFSVRIRKHRIMGARRKPSLFQPVVDLFSVGARLLFVGSGQHQIIPFDKAGLC